MTAYSLVADFSNHESSCEVHDTKTVVKVPFLDKEGKLRYGIGNALSGLHKKGIYPTEEGIDYLCLAGLVYLADTRISRRKHSQDSWTREIKLVLPVFSPEKWNDVADRFSKMLNFLTGDRWDILFIKRNISLVPNEIPVFTSTFNVATLFSGGMDSLISTINNLEQGKKVALISHAGDGHTKKAQRDLLAQFQESYSEIAPTYLELWMVHDKMTIPYGGLENTTRSRSFLFISYGIFAISGMTGVRELQVPENGLIALNVPLDGLRVGSHSTRTTHPFYLDLWNQVLDKTDMGINTVNPYWHKTKGEMAAECLNQQFLLKIIGDSSSCSSPTKSRWGGARSQHCGYCVPCLIRRAAINQAFGLDNDPTKYFVEDVNIMISSHAKSKGVQLRSFQVAINKLRKHPEIAKTYVFKTGNLDGTSDYLKKAADVYKRGLFEVDDFIQTSLQKSADTGE